MSELKRCPFCGGEAEMHSKCNDIETGGETMLFVRCSDCWMGSRWAYTSMRAMELWNTRKPMDRVLERLEEQKSDEIKYWEEFADFDSFRAAQAYHNAIEIIKEEGVQ